MTLDEATRRLERWTHSLLDLVPRDRLIDRTETDEVQAVPFATAIGATSFALAGGARVVRPPRPDGDHVTWLAIGALWWSVGEAGRVRRAPVILVPVEVRVGTGACDGEAGASAPMFGGPGLLSGAACDGEAGASVPMFGGPGLLSAAACDGEAGASVPMFGGPGLLSGADDAVVTRVGVARINHALVEAVRAEAGIELPPVGAAIEPAQLAATLDAIAARLAEVRPAWAIERAAYVTVVSTAAVALWRDLAHGSGLAEAPLVRRLALAEPIDDLPAGPAPALVLDADADQLAVATAALAGHSVVVAAPPGTGAAQTAANLTAAALADGKTVLVVANRRAALAAFRRHLDAAGVGEFALALDVASDGRAVAAALVAIADRSWRPGGAAVGAIDRRDQVAGALDAYAAALHERTGLGLSMFDAVARLIELKTSPRLQPSAIDLAGLDPDELGRRRGALVDYARAATAVAPIGAHPWRMSAVSELPGGETAAVAEALTGAATAAGALAGRLAELAALIPGLAPRSRAELEAAGALFAIAARTPRPGADLIAAGPPPATAEVRVDPSRALPASAIPRDPAAYVALARRQRKLRDELAERWTPAVGELDLDGLASKFRSAEHRSAFGRWLALRGPRAEARAALAGDARLPDDLTVASELDIAAEERAARRLLGEAAGPARRWFGQLATTRDASDLPDLDALDLDQVDAALWWARDLRTAFDAVPIAGSRDAAWRALIAQVCAPARGEAESVDAPFAEAAAAVEAWTRALAAVVEVAGVAAAAIDGGAASHLAGLAAQVAAWQAALGHLPAWAEYVRMRTAARVAGLAPVVTACESGQLATEQAVDAWERTVLLAIVAQRVGAAPALAQFHGAQHHARAVELGDLTRAAQLAVRSRGLARLADRVPRKGDDATAVLAAELARPSARSARDVLDAAEDLVPRLAPCVLATPAAVAEHLDPARRFDLVVVLEAGAIPTATAIGALARAHAAVILGLPAEGSVFSDAAARLPALALRTHYRSRHEDVFAFANARWFGDALTVFPAPAAEPGRAGVVHRAIDGDAADAIAMEVIAHLGDAERRTRSLAVIGFDDVLLARVADRLAAARAVDPALDAAFAADEPPVVLHAALADGAVRDVAIVAFDRAGEPDHLAVAATRARELLIVMSAPGIAAGGAAEALIAHARRHVTPLDAAPSSPFTAAIGAALVARGWSVRHQVGTGPYRVDLAVLDPDDSSRYVLGIETDGAAYGSAAAAGDRDRLRAQVLAARGWRLHRVWCLDWWADPEREAQRAHGAVISAIAAARQARRPAAPRSRTRTRPDAIAPLDAVAPTESAPTVARGSRPTATKSAALLSGLSSRMIPTVAPYQAASVPAGRRRPDDLFEPRHADELGKLIDRVLEVEAPIHLSLLSRRVAAYFGVGKVTPRIADRVRTALVGRAHFGAEPDILWRLDQDPSALPIVRVSADSVETKRDISEIPLSEIAAAATVIRDRAPSISAVDLLRDSARLLGFARITDPILARIRAGTESI